MTYAPDPRPRILVKANVGKAAGGLAAALVFAIPLIATYEGKRNVGYLDPAPARYETICYGHKQAGVLGARMSDEQCVAMLLADARSHGLEIAPCLPLELPTPTHAAFVSFAFNVGAKAFCRSNVSHKARAGDLRGACAELSRWTRAGGRTLPGLVKRRAVERALCEEGLR